MIYLKGRKLLFIKTGKTAGTSIEIALSCNAGPDDIVTPFGSFEDELKRDEVGGHFPVNWAVNREDEELSKEKFRALKTFNKAGRLPEGKIEAFRGERRCRSHARADEIVEAFGEAFLHDNHVVSVCRHPYDRLVSGAYFRDDTKDDDSSLRETIAQLLNRKKPQGFGHYYYEGKLVADTILRYEHLEEDLKSLESRFDLQLVANLPRTKHTYRTDRRPASEILTAAEKDRCYELHKVFFDEFGYER